MKELIDPPAIVGEVVAGEAAKVQNKITDLVSNLNSSTFDLAELLHVFKVKQLYAKQGFNTLGEFFKEVGLKSSKAHYLIRIVSAMLIANIDRSVYEGVGIAKLRIITRLDPLKEYDNKPAADIIKNLVEVAKDVDAEVLEEAVSKYLGQVDDEAVEWMNFKLTKSVKQNVVKPAIEKMRLKIGNVGKDEEGNSVDASDGRCLELMSAEVLSGE